MAGTDLLVSPGASVGGPGGDAPALVAEQSQVPEGTTVKPGARFGGSD